MEQLPSELLRYLYSYLSVRDAKAIALTSKICYQHSRDLIWNRPILKSLNVEELSQLQTLPIKYLNTSVFRNSRHGMGAKLIEDLNNFLSLKQLVLQFQNFDGLKTEDLSIILKLECDLHIFSSAVRCWNTEVVDMLKSRKGVTSLSLDSRGGGWGLHDLRQLIGIHIIHLSISSIHLFDRDNVCDAVLKEEEFIEVLSLLKPDIVDLCDNEISLLTFAENDLKNMSGLKIRSIISSLMFDTAINPLQPWLVLKSFPFLEKIVLGVGSFISCERLTKFPIKTFIVHYQEYGRSNLWCKDIPLESLESCNYQNLIFSEGHLALYGSVEKVFEYFITGDIVEGRCGQYQLRYTLELNFKYIYSPFWTHVMRY